MNTLKLKRYIIAIVGIIIFSCQAFAKIEYVEGTFKSLAESNQATSGSDIGTRNMTDNVIDDWKTNTDGDDVNAILIISFENLTPEEMKEISITSLSNGKIVSHQDKELRTTDGVLSKWFYIPYDKRPFDIDLAHPVYGTTRIPNVTMDLHKVYKAKLRADGFASVAITSKPTGATLFFDNQNMGKTPVTIPKVALGKHNVVIEPNNLNIAKKISETIDVSPTNTSFDFNLMKHKDVVFQAEPSNAELALTQNGTVISRSKGTLRVSDLEFGTYIVKGYVGKDDNETVVEINNMTPDLVKIKVIPSTSISFTANQNNAPVSGADVNVDGVFIGQTPITHKVEYGRHMVSISHGGYSASKHFSVGKGKESAVNVKLPNRHKYRHNLFDIDYNAREWGFAFNYINRAYIYKAHGRSEKYNFYLEDKRESGIQMGITYQGYYGYGQGIQTGLYWQMFFGTPDFIDDNPHYYEHALYVPLQYQFRLPLSENISIFANAGMGFTLGLENSLEFSDDDKYSLGYGYNEDYDMLFPKQFDCSLIFGGGIQFGVIQLEAKYNLGLINQNQILEMSDIYEGSMKSSSWQVGISFLF